MKLYIAGPVRGKDPQRCIDAFDAAEAQLIARDYEVFNPLTEHKHLLKEADKLTVKELKQIFREDIEGLFDCDGVVLLEKWEDSKGATGEFWIARACNMPALDLNEWLHASRVAEAILRQTLGAKQ